MIAIGNESIDSSVRICNKNHLYQEARVRLGSSQLGPLPMSVPPAALGPFNIGLPLADFHTLPFKTDDYLADTRHLTAAQHGAYFLLLLMAWRSPDNALPNDDVTLAKWACMDRRTWLRNREVVLAFWVLGPDARWRQKNLDKTRKYVADLISKKSAAGQASALKRRDTHQTPVQHNGNRRPNSESESEIIKLNKNDRSEIFITDGKEVSCRKGTLVSAGAIAKACQISISKGIVGGEELGHELEVVFLNYISEEPRNPDAAFLAWVPKYLNNHKAQ
jgi:uncharacterized protein YdaU (DUF1376 family)